MIIDKYLAHAITLCIENDFKTASALAKEIHTSESSVSKWKNLKDNIRNENWQQLFPLIRGYLPKDRIRSTGSGDYYLPENSELLENDYPLKSGIHMKTLITIDGPKLKYLRLKNDITLEELGRKLGGLHKVNVSKWESETRPVPAKYHDKICEILNVKIEDIGKSTPQLPTPNEKNSTYNYEVTISTTSGEPVQIYSQRFTNLDTQSVINHLNQFKQPVTNQKLRSNPMSTKNSKDTQRIIEIVEKVTTLINKELDEFEPKSRGRVVSKVLGATEALLNDPFPVSGFSE